MTNRNTNMATKFSKRAFALSSITTSMIVMSASAYANQAVTAMNVTAATPNLTQLKIDFDGSPVAPKAYFLDNPTRLVLDFEQVSNQLPSRFITVNQGAIKEVTTLNNDKVTRLIVVLQPLNSDSSYTTEISGNSLLLNIGTGGQYNPVTTNNSVIEASPISEQENIIIQNSSNATDKIDTQTMVVQVNPLLNPANQVARQYNYAGISAIDFTEANGGADITIALTNESIPLDVQRQGSKLVVRMTGATVPKNLLRRLNVGGGLVSSIDTKNQGQNGAITINMNEDFEYQAYQSGNQLNISVTPPKLLRQPTLEERVYDGEPISLELQDVPVRSVLDTLALHTSMNIIASDDVSGNVTIRLYNVPWDQAFDIILKSKGLDKRENGNVIWVAPATQLATQEAEELEAQQKVDTFLPLRTEYIRLSYAKAANVLTLISQGRNSSSNDNNNDSGSLLSARGTVTIDNRTNTLIVKDTAKSIENIRALVEQIDIPVRQVMIEARIVSANDSFSKEIGVKWGILSNGAANNRNLLVGGSEQTLWDLKKFDVQTTTINGQQVSYPSYDITRPNNLNVDLGANNPAGRIAFGLLSMSDMMLDLELSAMQADNRGEVISTPKVLTADKQTAKVSSGTQIPYQEAAASGATSTSFREAALSLEATPNITPDGKIGLELTVTNGTPTIINGSVAIAEDSINTNVLVEDGQTIVLGGVFKNQLSNGVEKVPFLGDLPYIGKLFRKDIKRNDKQELLIFVTPKLINDGVSRIN